MNPTPTQKRAVLRLALPKGRMQAGVLTLLSEAGLPASASDRDYRPRLPLAGCDTKLLKPQNIVEMLHHGSRDLGFAGGDWVAEIGVELVELLDTGLDPVRIVAAASADLMVGGALPRRRLVVASEYERLARGWIAARDLDALYVRSFGATEVFPPEDADVIVDNTATGATLRDNGLVVVDEVMQSSTRLFACPRSLEDPAKRTAIEELVMLLESVLQARTRVMVELNVARRALDEVIAVLPCMRQPTIAPLFGDEGFAVKAAVQKGALPSLVLALKERGATDIVVSKLSQIVP